MKWNTQVFLIVMLLAAIGAANSAIGQTVYSTGLDSNPLMALHPINSDSQPFEKVPEKSLSLRFSLENLSSDIIEGAVVGVYLYTGSGEPKGSYSYLVKDEISALESAYHSHTKRDVRLNPDDRVVVVVEAVISNNDGWEIHESLDPAAILKSSYLSRAGSPGLKTAPLCETWCDARLEKCGATCGRCGSIDFSCACGSDGTKNFSCKCSECTPITH